MEQNRRILFVDDDRCILDAMRRNLRKAFEVHVAQSGQEGLTVLQEKGPFAVVVSDMRMPEMDGAEFLGRVKELAPQTVRVMLTGAADIQSAMAAVNEGNIFRFVTKPADPHVMAKAMRAALDQHRLLTSERQLIENTLNASVNVLVEMLAVTNPAAFSRSMRVKELTVLLVQHLSLEEAWQYELAAMLSQIGAVTVPLETMEKYMIGDTLSREEEEMIADHPVIGAKLIASIPRLQHVAGIIRRQQQDAGKMDYNAALSTEDLVGCGAHILHAVIDFDMLMTRGMDRAQTLMTMQTRQDAYHPKVLGALSRIHVPERKESVQLIAVTELCNGMILAEDVKSRNGVLIVTKGQRVTDTLRRCLENNSIRDNIPSRVRVCADAF
jgi:response regulator RpfG family c-di-GMP phosphodiesterase